MSESLSPEQRQILTELVVDFNDRLVTEKIDVTGQAFNNALRLGCTILAVPLIIILVIAYFVSDRFDITTIIVFSGAAFMLSMVFAATVANRAKTIVVRDNYTADINPDLVKALSENGFSRRQFDMRANEHLDSEAPLRDYIILAAKIAAEDAEEARADSHTEENIEE